MATSILATVVALSSHLSLTDATGMSANREVKLFCKKHLLVQVSVWLFRLVDVSKRTQYSVLHHFFLLWPMTKNSGQTKALNHTSKTCALAYDH